MQSAATPWKKYKPDDPFAPQLGEGALWSMEINGKRNYFYGHLFHLTGQRSGPVCLAWQGGGAFELNDSIYWARIIHLELVSETAKP